jgi:multicomponent Na+:H+ antiporter subunit C
VTVLPYLAAGWLFLVGLYGVVTSRNLIHMVICLTVVQAGTYVLLVAVAYRSGGFAPFFGDIPPDSRVADPVLHALALVDVVVEAAVSALLLALAVQAEKRFGTIDPEDLRPLRG